MASTVGHSPVASQGTLTDPAARHVHSRDPATGEAWQSYPAASREEVFAAVARARAVHHAWGAEPLAVRIRVLRRFHESLFRRRHEVAEALSRENGKPASDALANEIAVVLDFARYYADRTPKFLRAPWFTASALAFKRKRVRIAHEPLGVVGIIAPWNYPLMLAAAIALPALVTGNAVVIKPSEFSPTTGALLAQLLHEAGVPADACIVVQGDGLTGAALTDSAVDKIFFTGSVATGRKVAVKCADRLIPCSLELGGSDAAIVLADADVRHAASGIAWGRFNNAGQTCVAPKRVYVEAPAYDAFIAALGAVVSSLRVGSGRAADSDVGAMIHPGAVAALSAQLDDALARGATVYASAAAATDEHFFAPTVLTDVPTDSSVLREETFGPLLPVVRVRDADEAIALANDSEFGLSASIWTRDTARAARLATRLDAGSVVINDSIVAAGMCDVPHGGVKRSGIGRTHGMAGLEECVRTKATVADRFSGWRQAWWFGYGPQRAAGLDAYIRVAHGRGTLDRLRALPAFIRLIFSPQRPL